MATANSSKFSMTCRLAYFAERIDRTKGYNAGRHNLPRGPFHLSLVTRAHAETDSTLATSGPHSFLEVFEEREGEEQEKAREDRSAGFGSEQEEVGVVSFMDRKALSV